MLCRRQREEKDPGIDLPERSLADEHPRPALSTPLVQCCANAGLFTGNETHSL